MHVHDVDIMVWLLGTPSKIYSVASHKNAAYESVYAVYQYDDCSASVVADWGLPSSFKFREALRITFENAYLEINGSKMTLYTDEKAEDVNIDGEKGIVLAENEFISCVVDNIPLKTAPIESVYETMKTVFAEKEFIKNNKN